MTKPSKTRVSVDLSPTSAERLEQLRAQFRDDPSKTEIIRRSLGLLELLKKARDDGQEPTVMIKTKEGQVVELPLDLYLDPY